MIRIITWLWRQPQGRTTYNAGHVNIFADMVRRNCSLPYSLGCVTDMPEGISPDIDIIRLPTDFADIQPSWGPRKPNCYRRLAMYRRDAAAIFGGERIASFDLDCVIGGDLAPILDREEDLVLFKGTSANRPYNGSLQLITAGCRPEVFEEFSEDGAIRASTEFRGSDQAWLAYCLGWDEATWSEADGVHWWKGSYPGRGRRVEPRVLFFPGALKPWHIAPVERFVGKHYRMREAA